MAKTIKASDIIIIGLFCSGALNFDVLALRTQDRYLGERAGQCMPTTMDKHCGIRSFSCQPSRSRTQSFQENRLLFSVSRSWYRSLAAIIILLYLLNKLLLVLICLAKTQFWHTLLCFYCRCCYKGPYVEKKSRKSGYRAIQTF